MLTAIGNIKFTGGRHAPRTYRMLTEEQKKQVLDGIRDGEFYSVIARQVGCNCDTVRRYARLLRRGYRV